MLFIVFANWKCRPNSSLAEYAPSVRFKHLWGPVKPSARNFRDRIHPDDFPDYRQELWSSIKRRAGFAWTYRFETPEGYKTLFSCGEPFLQEGGTYVGHCGFDLMLGDITQDLLEHTIFAQLTQKKREKLIKLFGPAIKYTPKGVPSYV